MLTPLGAYKKYVALKAHFTSKYNFYSSSGKTSASQESFDRRQDKKFFEYIAKRFNETQIEEILISNFVYVGDSWIGDLLSNEAMDVYYAWRGKTESIAYLFKNDLIYIKEHCEERSLPFNGIFKSPQKEDLPEITWLCEHKQISIETAVILDLILNFIDRAKLDNIIWNSWATRIKKYQVFIDKKFMTDDLKKTCIQELKKNFLT